MLNKKILIAAAVGGLMGTSAMAESYFTFEGLQERDLTVELDEVVSDGDGVVAVYDYSGGEFGEILGTEDVNQGANTDVRVRLDMQPTGDIAAVLYVGEVGTPDQSVAWVEIDVETLDEMESN